jgi:hypothetical protein
VQGNQAINKLLVAFVPHQCKDLTAGEHAELEVQTLLDAGMIAPAKPPEPGFVLTVNGNNTMYLIGYMQRRTDPALTNTPPLISDHNGERQVWCVDERGEVYPVPQSMFSGVDPLDLLAQKGWRYATREEFEAARERALNSADN